MQSHLKLERRQKLSSHEVVALLSTLGSFSLKSIISTMLQYQQQEGQEVKLLLTPSLLLEARKEHLILKNQIAMFSTQKTS